KTADQKLQQLKEEYPYSAYATEQPISPEPKSASKEKPITLKQKNTVQKFAAGFTVQVGAFSTLPNASDLKEKFEKEGYTANIFTIVSNGKKMHKVWVGEFQNYDEAKRSALDIKKKFNLSSIVVSR
ncbi:MAG TPA: SPOR domain-containing protein, partial [Bacteroidota bacterium]|nr:SPOR domain-containing protein [Bacteroidota bacterium]